MIRVVRLPHLSLPANYLRDAVSQEQFNVRAQNRSSGMLAADERSPRTEEEKARCGSLRFPVNGQEMQDTAEIVVVGYTLETSNILGMTNRP